MNPGPGQPWTRTDSGSVRSAEPPGRSHKWLTQHVAELEARVESLQEALTLYEAENAWLWAEVNHAAS